MWHSRPRPCSSRERYAENRTGSDAQSAQRDVLLVFRLSNGELGRTQSTHYLADGNLALDARKRGAEAEVDAHAERKVTVLDAGDVEAIWVGELA